MPLSKYIDIESARWRPPAVILACTTVFVFLAVELFELPKDMMLWRELQNAGHIPVFGLLTALIIKLSKKYLMVKQPYVIFIYFSGIIAASMLGLLLEVLQYFGPRDADWNDFIRDVAGAVAFALIYLACDRSIINRAGGWSKFLKVILIVAAIAIFAVAIIPVVDLGTSYWQRNKSFPIICDFESPWQAAFTGTQGAQLEYVSAPGGWTDNQTGRVGKLTFSRSKYPGISFREPVRDWSACKSLRFDIYSGLTEPFNLLARVNDKYHNNSYGDRFNTILTINPGLNEIEIPLDRIRRAPGNREMDMAHISLIVLFVASPENEFSIYLDNVRLEK